jgi:hypothetical protein
VSIRFLSSLYAAFRVCGQYTRAACDPYLARGGGGHVPCSAPKVLWELLRSGWKDDVLQPEVDEYVVEPQELVQYLHEWKILYQGTTRRKLDGSVR